MKRRFRVHATLQLESKIHQLDDFLQQKLILAKSNYETRLIETYQSSNSSNIFSYIRSLSTQNMLPSTLYLENILATTDFEKASLFNLYFHSVFTKSTFQLPQLNELDLRSLSFVILMLVNQISSKFYNPLMCQKLWAVMELVLNS